MMPQALQEFSFRFIPHSLRGQEKAVSAGMGSKPIPISCCWHIQRVNLRFYYVMLFCN